MQTCMCVLIIILIFVLYICTSFGHLTVFNYITHLPEKLHFSN